MRLYVFYRPKRKIRCPNCHGPVLRWICSAAVWILDACPECKYMGKKLWKYKLDAFTGKPKWLRRATPTS